MPASSSINRILLAIVALRSIAALNPRLYLAALWAAPVLSRERDCFIRQPRHHGFAAAGRWSRRMIIADRFIGGAEAVVTRQSVKRTAEIKAFRQLNIFQSSAPRTFDQIQHPPSA